MSEINIVSSPIGIFGVNDKGEIADKVLFRKDVSASARTLSSLQRGEVTEEVEEIVAGLKSKGFGLFVLEDTRLGKAVGSLFAVDVEIRKKNRVVSCFRARLVEVATELGFVETPLAFNQWLREVATSIVRIRIRESSARRDLQVVQGVLALDDLDRTTNLYASRVREWYGLYFPELGDLVDKHETYLRLILGFGNRTEFEVSSLKEIGFTDEKSRAIAEVASDSVGAEISEEDLAQIRAMAELVLRMFEIRRNVESYLEGLMLECAPNINGLVGPSIGARLLALAGGLQRLARMPASTIQVLGAESALFRSLQTGSRPPKHGIIFQSPLIHQAERRKRGKIARALAGKLAIAARIDAFSDRYDGDSLRRDVERRIEEIDSEHVSSSRKRRRRG